MSRDNCKTGDAVQLGPEIAPGARIATRHHADHTAETVICTRAKDGAPIPPGAEVVHLDDERGGWQKVLGSFKAAGDGPAQVATPAYRAGYDRIFGKKPDVGLA